MRPYAMFHLSILLFFGNMGALAQVPNKEDLIEILITQNSRIDPEQGASLEFTVEVSPVYYYPLDSLPDMFRRGDVVARRTSVFVMKGTQRRFEEQIWDPSGDTSVPIGHRVETWNGIDFMEYLPNEGQGNIYPNPSEARLKSHFLRSPTPFEVAGYSHDPLTPSGEVRYAPVDRLSSPNTYLDPEQTIVDDSQCIVLHDQFGSPILYLDINRGYVVKKARLSTISAWPGITEKWIYNDAFLEIETGLFLATSSRVQWVGPSPTGAGEETVIAETVYHFADISYRTYFPDDLFVHPWPNGTIVADFRLGDPVEPMIWGNFISSEHLDNLLQSASRLSIEVEGSSGVKYNVPSEGTTDALSMVSAGHYKWVSFSLAISVVLLILFLIATILRRGRKCLKFLPYF